jgi:hypothetical protein
MQAQRGASPRAGVNGVTEDCFISLTFRVPLRDLSGVDVFNGKRLIPRMGGSEGFERRRSHGLVMTPQAMRGGAPLFTSLEVAWMMIAVPPPLNTEFSSTPRVT